MIYVFCGGTDEDNLNSIEMISESALVTQLKKRWTLIQVPRNDLAPRNDPAVAPINETEIAIMGGWGLSDVVIFNTTTKACQKVVTGG